MANIANASVSCSFGFGVPFRLRSNANAASLWKLHHNIKTTRLCFNDSVNLKGGRVIRAMASPTVSAPKREKDLKKRVVITGMGLVSVFGNDVDVFYDKLLNGESGISIIDKFDASSLPARIAGQIRGFSSKGYIDKENDRCITDFTRYCIVAGKKALETANLGPQVLQTMDKDRIGVLIGAAIGGAPHYYMTDAQLLMYKANQLLPYCIHIPNIGPAVLAIETGLMGPNYSISAACSTANHCLISAANHIRKGDADIMVAGGAEAPLAAQVIAGFVACRALSTRNEDPSKASRPWDTNRDGFVVGEGAGVLVMESLESAMKRDANIVAEFLGGAVTCDAHNVIAPRPDLLGVSDCIIKSLKYAQVSPEEVNYVNCHATSTPAGDIAEIAAIKQVFNNTSEMKINATKSLIGHCMGAAGGLEAIATIKAINTGWLHPTINQYNLEAEVTLDTVPNVKKRHQVNVAISNSIGIGGINGTIVLAPFTP